MKVQSTGLGKTLMLAHFKELIKTNFDDKQVLQVTMEATEPLHWTIKVYMEPKDLREALGLGLKPSIVWKALLAIIFGRFSLFKKTERDSHKLPQVPGTQPVMPPETSASSNSSETPSPLASLKESPENNEMPNPLASLKG